MRFSQEYLSNRMFDDQPLSLESACLESVDGIPTKTGILRQPNGDVLFRIYAPLAAHVSIKGPGLKMLDLVKGAKGLFEGSFPYTETLAGPVTVKIFTDGREILYPYIPIYWVGNRPVNFFEMPSPEGAYWALRDVPHGTVGREIYYSGALKDWKRCMVYTPPGYMKSDTDYPVAYLLHGGTANEIDWLYSGRAAYLFDNLIAEGKVRPFIAVMTNGMVRFPGSGGVVWDDALEQMLVQDVIPYIDENYRTKTDKWNRALAGLSMGAYMTNDIGFRHPDLFGYMGQFTACMTHLQDFPNYERPFTALMKELKKDPGKFSEMYRVFFRSTTPNEDHFDYFEADDAILAEAGVDGLPSNYRVVYPENTSKWESWRLGLRDFVQLIF